MSEQPHEMESQHSHGAATATAEPAAEAVGTAVPEGPLFEDDELAQFDADDVTAGSALCKMLSLFFLYTVIAMAIVGAWTASVALE
jgi:hypothetical protein